MKSILFFFVLFSVFYEATMCFYMCLERRRVGLVWVGGAAVGVVVLDKLFLYLYGWLRYGESLEG